MKKFIVLLGVIALNGCYMGPDHWSHTIPDWPEDQVWKLCARKLYMKVHDGEFTGPAWETYFPDQRRKIDVRMSELGYECNENFDAVRVSS